MFDLLKTNTGRLRIIGLLEGLSFLILLGINMPMKYFYDSPAGVKIVGPIHGILFILYIFYVFIVASEQQWKLFQTTWKFLLASVFPFGTFYVDYTILKKIKPKS